MKSKLEEPPKTKEEEQLDQALKEQGVVETTCAVLSANCPNDPADCKPMQKQLMLVQDVFVRRAKKQLKS